MKPARKVNVLRHSSGSNVSISVSHSQNTEYSTSMLAMPAWNASVAVDATLSVGKP